MDTTAPLIRALNDYQQTIDLLLSQIANLTAELAQAKEAQQRAAPAQSDA